jgi:tryptophan synthase alpha chain
MATVHSEASLLAAGQVARTFARCREEGRAALVTFLAAGDPDLETTVTLAQAVAEAGADVLELGIPFSDPLADGPIIQAAYTRALAAGATVRGVLHTVERIVGVTGLPVVLMTACNPVLAYGIDAFCRDAAGAGAAGLLVPDLLPEDAAELRRSARRHGLDTVFLGAPGGAEQRLRAADEASTGFLYLLSRRGVTGPQSGMGEALEAEVERARACCRNPLAVGFGVATADDAARVAAVADGVIVGSVLVDAVARATDAARARGATPAECVAAACEAVRSRVAELVTGIRAARRPMIARTETSREPTPAGRNA